MTYQESLNGREKLTVPFGGVFVKLSMFQAGLTFTAGQNVTAAGALI